MPFRRRVIPTKHLLPFLSVTLFITQIGISLSDLPSTMLIQDIICKNHMGIRSDGLLPEESCRGEAVQRELNVVNVGIGVSTTVGGALVALPLGMAADRLGRIPILGLSVLSIFLSQGYAILICWKWKTVPIRAVWALGAPLLLGGGEAVSEAMVFTIISDVVPSIRRATWFQYVFGAVIAGQIVAPPLAGLLMRASGIWLPLCLSLGLILLGCIVLTLFTPETIDKRITNSQGNSSLNRPSSSGIHAVKALFSRPALFLFPGAILSTPIAMTQSDLLLRLMPIQFGWPLSQSALLGSLRALLMLVTLLLLLPGATVIFQRRTRYSPLGRDRLLVRTSALLLATGSICLVFSTTKALVILGIVISAFGTGAPTLCRSILVSLLDGDRTGQILGVLAVGEVLGALGCNLGIGSLFGIGLGSWIGLPFCVALLFSLTALLATWSFPALNAMLSHTVAVDEMLWEESDTLHLRPM